MDNFDKDDWRKTLLPIDATIAEAIKSLNDSAMQIVLVLAPDGVLFGTVTDGDIRRGLINHASLDQPLSRLANRSFLSVRRSVSQRGEALHLMKKHRISAIPVVNQDLKPVGIEFLQEPSIPRQGRNELVVLMAGGMGLRLRPLTEHVPKPMLKVKGKPILQRLLEQLIDQGFQRFVFTLNYLGHVIQDYFQDGSAWNASIEYIEEDQPLGTAGALRLIDPAPQDTFVVMNGDVISQFDVNDLLGQHRERKVAATMAVSLQKTDLAYGVVQTKNGVITDIEEKPSLHHLVNAGLYALEPRAVRLIPEGKLYNMTDLFRDLIDQDEATQAFALYEDWLDIGQPDQYRAANDVER
jgi:dTDP-glucose pyrophosphorylase